MRIEEGEDCEEPRNREETARIAEAQIHGHKTFKHAEVGRVSNHNGPGKRGPVKLGYRRHGQPSSGVWADRAWDCSTQTLCIKLCNNT